MAWIWTFLLLASIIGGILTGQTGALSPALLDGAASGITVAISLAGPLCLWSGANRLLEACGALEGLARGLAPILQRLFPTAWKIPSARQALCGNFSANLLGLGNAATPLGIQAVRAMHTGDGRASDELCRLVVLNTASIQLIPATVAALRAGLGSAAPFDILPAVWITSLCSVAAGILAAGILARWVR